jgi:hypothetical protein
MPTPFADLEDRIHRAARDRLANAEAVVGEVTVSGIFRLAYAEAVGGLAAGSQPAFECRAADVGALSEGDVMTVRDESWRVIGLEPDGAGWLRVLLQRAA